MRQNWLRSLVGEQSIRVGEVNLSGRPIEDADLVFARTLPDIRRLYLDGTQISDAALAQLVRLRQLETLSLRNTNITNAGLALLRELPSIQTLDLEQTQVTLESLDLLKRMPKLKFVSMLGLHLNAEDLADRELVKQKLQFLDRSDVVSDSTALDQILQAWKERQDSVRSLAVTCGVKDERLGKTTQSSLEVVFDTAGRVCISCKGVDVLDDPAIPLLEYEAINAFDGDRTATMFARSTANGKPLGTISRQGIFDWCNNPSFRPLALAYRTLQRPEGGVFASGSLALCRNVLTIDGEECVGLYHATGMVWVSPSRGYLPMRYVTIDSGVFIEDIQIAYTRHPELGWVLTSWKVLKRNAYGTETGRNETTVISCRINEAVSDSDFRIAFPEGTLVDDQTDNKTYLVGKNGSQVPVSRAECESRIGEQFDFDPARESRAAASGGTTSEQFSH